jgi:hypothetical protein
MFESALPQYSSLRRDIVISVVLPVIVIEVCLHYGLPTIVSIAIGSIFPLVELALNLARKNHHLDPTAAISLVFMAIGLATSFLSRDIHFALAKESIFTGVFGLIYLGSLFASRPLTFHIGRAMASKGNPEVIARWNVLWGVPQFRAVMRLMSVVWGGTLIAEAAARFSLTWVLPPSIMVIVSPVLAIATIAALFWWTRRTARHHVGNWQTQQTAVVAIAA